MINEHYVVLVVEDDDKLRESIRDYLQLKNYKVIEARDGKEAQDKFFENSYQLDMVLLDGMLPKVDGLDVLKYIRESSDIPVVMLTAREGERDHLKAYRYGADVYMTKPFKLSIMEAQMQALIQRYLNLDESCWEEDGIRIDFLRQTAEIEGREVLFTKKEFELLKHFVENPGIVLTRENIIDAVWGQDYYGDTRTIDTFVKQLRKKFGEKSGYIQSVYGVGYKFEVGS